MVSLFNSFPFFFPSGLNLLTGSPFKAESVLQSPVEEHSPLTTFCAINAQGTQFGLNFNMPDLSSVSAKNDSLVLYLPAYSPWQCVFPVFPKWSQCCQSDHCLYLKFSSPKYLLPRFSAHLVIEEKTKNKKLLEVKWIFFFYLLKFQEPGDGEKGTSQKSMGLFSITPLVGPGEEVQS